MEKLSMSYDKKGVIYMAASRKTTKPVTKDAETTAKAVIGPEPEKEAKKAATAVVGAAKTVKKEAAPKAVKKEAAPKPAVKKTSEKKAVVKNTVKKAEQKTSVHVQFSGKSYSQEDLIMIAKDVWKYDLKQKVRELTSIDLYVKPEENLVYYVMNQSFTGSFVI